mgnify:CR=1 FL=1
MAEQTELILQQMDETRASMVEKVELLERQVADTVKDTAQTVAETVHTATEAVDKTVTTVSDTVEAVTETFNIRGHIERHPWIAFGGAVLIGYLAASAFSGRRRSSSSRYEAPSPAPRPTPESSSGSSENKPSHGLDAQTVGSPSTLNKVFDQIKGLAIGSAVGLGGQILTAAVPDTVRDQVGELVDEVTHFLGGTPSKGNDSSSPSRS